MPSIKPLTPELQKIAIDELGEVPERIPQDLCAIKQWIEQQPHLKARTDHQFLIQFLRGCKYSLERVKEKIDLLYTLKTNLPNMFGITDVNNARFREMLNIGCFALLPMPLNGNGPRIVVIRFNFGKEPIEEMYTVLNVMNEIVLTDDPYGSINGIIYIADMANLTASHVLQFTPSVVKKLLLYYDKSLPLRIKGAYHINVPGITAQLFKLVYSFASEKLKQRFYFCGNNLDELCNYIPRKYLPKDYGGDNGLLDDIVKEYNKKLDEYQEYFHQNAEFGTNEKLRPGKPIDFDSMFGIGGSFRKLDVD